MAGTVGRPTSKDWDGIRRDYVRGMSIKELSTRYSIAEGTIYQRAWREDWKALVGHARETANRAIEEILENQKKVIQATLTDEISRWQERVKEVNSQILAKVEDLLPSVDKMDSAQKAAGAVATADSTVRRALGLDNGEDKGSRLNLMVIGKIDDILAGQAAKPVTGTVTDTTAGLPVDYQSGKPGQVIDVQASPIL